MRVAQDEAGLRDAFDQGLLDESHVMDLKRELSSGKSANDELARDLASFAVDGGQLVLGVDEKSGLYPIPLAGLAERVEQVGRSLVDEPLQLEFQTIPTATDPANGYLIVVVPASPRAPHMVRGRYWGRGDKTKHQLGDAEVERLMARRSEWGVAAVNKARAWFRNYPALRQHVRGKDFGSLFVYAAPVPLRERACLDLVKRGSLSNLATATRPGVPIDPDVGSAVIHTAMAGGYAMRTEETHKLYVSSGSMVDNPERLLELQLTDDGEVRVHCGRAVVFEDLGGGRVREDQIIGMTYRAVQLAAAAGEEMNHAGFWDLVVFIDSLWGGYSSELSSGMPGPGGPAYSESEYEQMRRVNQSEMRDRPRRVVEELLSPLLRGLGWSGDRGSAWFDKESG